MMAPKQLVSEEDYRSAIARGRQALASPHAVGAIYLPGNGKLVVIMSTGEELIGDVRSLPVIRDHSGEDLRDPVVTPGGDGILFEKAGLELGLPALLLAMRPKR
jgi:hypothetical protein